MAEKGNNNWLWWTIGGIATLGLGLGIYYYLRSGKDATAKEEEEKKKATENKGTTLPPPPPPVSKPTTSTSSTTTASTDPETPTNFNNKEQGNAFRRWVRAKDLPYAEKIDLSASGDFDNSYIRKAYAKYGSDFQKVNSEVLKNRFTSLTAGESWNQNDDQFGIAERYYESGDANNGARITFDRNGRVYIQGRKNGAYGSKWRAGGWYLRGENASGGSPILIFINGKEYTPFSSDLYDMRKDLVWAIWKDGGIWSGTAFSPFDGGNMGMTKFGFSTDGTKLQDVML
jgi:hypothetical protein